MKVVSENQNGIMNTLSLYFPSQFYFCLINKRKSFRGTQRRFPPTYALKNLSRLSRVLLYLQKCILSSSKTICVCSVILGQSEFCRNYQGFSIILLKILDVIQSFAKVRIFSRYSFHRIFEYANFRFPFSMKTEQLNIGREMRKFNFRKSQEIIR